MCDSIFLCSTHEELSLSIRSPLSTLDRRVSSWMVHLCIASTASHWQTFLTSSSMLSFLHLIDYLGSYLHSLWFQLCLCNLFVLNLHTSNSDDFLLNLLQFVPNYRILAMRWHLLVLFWRRRPFERHFDEQLPQLNQIYLSLKVISCSLVVEKSLMKKQALCLPCLLHLMLSNHLSMHYLLIRH